MQLLQILDALVNDRAVRDVMLFERGDKGFGSYILRVEIEVDFSRHGGEKFFQRGRPHAGERSSEPGARVQPGYHMGRNRSEEHTSELQSRPHLVCRLL